MKISSLSRRGMIVLGIFFIWFKIPLLSADRNQCTGRDLLKNLKNKIFTGQKVSILLKDAPIRNLFEHSPSGIPPLFPNYSGLKFRVAEAVNLLVSVRAEAVPWDQLLFQMLEKYKLKVMLDGDILQVKFKDDKDPLVPDGTLLMVDSIPPQASKNIDCKTGKKPSAKCRVLPQLHRPDSIAGYGEKLFITDHEKVYVLSIDNLQILTKIGCRGMGPGEFNPYPEIQDQGQVKVSCYGGEIWVGSRNKISRFSMSGRFIKDIRIQDQGAYCLTPLKDGFAGFGVTRFPVWKLDFYLYDKRGNKRSFLTGINKSIHLEKGAGKGPKLVFKDLLSCGPEYQVNKGFVYILGRQARYIDVFNGQGKKILEFDCDFGKIKIASSDKKRIWDLYKYNKGRLWPALKKIIKVPDYYPHYRTMRITGDRIFVQTYRRRGGETLFYIFRSDGGKPAENKYIRIHYRDSITPFPYTIHRSRVYSLVENPDTGDWEIHRDSI